MNPAMRMAETYEEKLAGLCRPVAEMSPMPMLAVQGAGHTISFANRAFCLLAGQAREELIGRPYCSISQCEPEALALLDLAYNTGQSQEHTGREGSVPHGFSWSYSVWPVLAVGSTVAGFLIQVTEVTSVHERMTAMNQALLIGSVRQHELAAESEKLNEALRWANDDLRQFAFAVSHDLQEPLRMITSYSQLLSKDYGGQLEEEAEVCLDFVTKGAKQMRELLAGLLSYTEVGAQREAEDFVDLNAIVAKVEGNLGSRIAETGAVIYSDKLPSVRGHDTRFIQLFQNLIGNAIKYGSESAPRIHITAEELRGEWRFGVADNGIGIEPEYHAGIFGVFKRLHGQSIPGTGIGLAICQRVVERYGGRIWVESRAGQGATFYFTLPTWEEPDGHRRKLISV